MVLKFSLWTSLTTTLCLVAPSTAEVGANPMTPDSVLIDDRQARYVLMPKILSLAKKAQESGHRSLSDHQKLLKLLRLLDRTSNSNSGLDLDKRVQKKRKFPEIDSRGFDEDIFDEGFGDWSPMKRW